MDKQELKKTLREQCAPFAESVRKKIEYLQGDDVFLAEEDNLQEEKDLSLEEAFDMAMLSEPSMTSFEDPLSGALMRPSVSERPLTSPSMPDFHLSPSTESSGDIAARQQNIQERKQNIAAKIAALRGISVPSAYINKKIS